MRSLTATLLLVSSSLCPTLLAGETCELDELWPSIPGPQQNFGTAVAVSGDTVMVGAPLADVAGASNQGRVEVHVRQGTSWSLQTTLTTPIASAGARFGQSIDIEGDFAVIGAYQDDFAQPNAGAVYVYERVAGSWLLRQRLTAFDAGSGDSFGWSLSLTQDRILVGAPEDDDNGGLSGSAYVYLPTAGVWTLEAKLLASDGALGDQFGYAVDIADDALLVGAPFDDDAGSDSGAAYAFERVAGSWSQASRLSSSDAAAGAHFGEAVTLTEALNGFVWLGFIGAPDSDVNGPGAGMVYSFSGFLGGGSWVESQSLFGSSPGGRFGAALDVRADSRRLAVGAPDSSGLGSVHVLEPAGNPYITSAILNANDLAGAGERFGAAVALGGDLVLAGSPLDSDLAASAGSASVFAVSFESFNSDVGQDCDGNGVTDLCDIASGSCPDLDGNGRIDACETTGSVCQSAPNSVGGGGQIDRGGSLGVSANQFQLIAREVPFGQNGLFFYGPSLQQLPFGDGFLCVAAGGLGLFRVNPPQPISFGDIAFRTLDFTQPPTAAGSITPGSSWIFQFWYRDPAGPGGTGFNLTDALRASFCP